MSDQTEHIASPGEAIINEGVEGKVENHVETTGETTTNPTIAAPSDKPIAPETSEAEPRQVVTSESDAKTEEPNTKPNAKKPTGPSIPKGNYALISVDVDATGRRLIDEIVQLAAYAPGNEFSQYVMPIMNLNPAARQRHQIRVITVGFFRMLKSMQTYKVVKTKTEINTLTDFLDYLERVNANTDQSLGVILIYHEQRKFVPYMILEAMGKYGLLPRFFKVVKGCLDGFALSETKLGNAIKYFTLKQMSKALLDVGVASDTNDRYEFEGNASIRARLAYQIIENFVASANKDDKTETKTMLDIVVNNAAAIDTDVSALSDQNKCMERQNSLRSIFVNYFKVTLYHRVKGVTYRRILAEHEYDLEKLNEIWLAKKKDGIAEVIAGIGELKTDDKTELIDLLDCHFDPEKQPILPIVKKHRSKRGNKENIKSKSNGMPASPDSTNKTPKRSQRRRRLSTKNQSENKQKLAIAAQSVSKTEVIA